MRNLGFYKFYEFFKYEIQSLNFQNRYFKIDISKSNFKFGVLNMKFTNEFQTWNLQNLYKSKNKNNQWGRRKFLVEARIYLRALNLS